MGITKKGKSNLIFFGIASTVLIFLFFTPWGNQLRTWMTSLTLSSPDVTVSEVKDKSLANIEIDWMIIDDQGKELWLSSVDQPIFLNIWATWCGPCRSEMPSIEALEEKYGDKVTFLLVSTTEENSVIKKYKESESFSFPLYTNGSYIPENLKTGTFPTTFIIAKDKSIAHKFIGAYNWDSDEVAGLLDEC